VYPPSITGATFLGQDLWEQSRVAFSYLQGPGYCGSPLAQTERGMSTKAITVTTSMLGKIMSSRVMSNLIDSMNNKTTVPDVKRPDRRGCTVFPVVIGETGSSMASATDRTWLNDFADFLMAKVRCEPVRAGLSE